MSQKATNRGLRIRSRSMMHACLSNTVCTEKPEPSRVRKKQAAGKKHKEERRTRERAAPHLSTMNTHERRKQASIQKTAPHAHPRNKQTQQTHSSNKKGGKQKTQEARTRPYGPHKTKKRKKKGKKKGGVALCLVSTWTCV